MVPDQKNRGNILTGALKEIFFYRELLFSLAARDIKVRYKQTFLGAAWAIFPSLITMLIFTFISRAKIIVIDTGDIPYPIFAYCGLLPWTLFSQSLSATTTSLVDYSGLINKIYFPREIIPLSVIFSKLINFFISALVLIGLMVFYRVKPQVTLIAVPLIFVIQIIFMAGIAFFLSMAHVFYRDVGYVVSGVAPLLMFITSVVYPIKVDSPQLQGVLNTLNPMIPIIDAYRNLVLKGRWPDMATLAVPVCLCLSMFFIGLIWFHKTAPHFAENI